MKRSALLVIVLSLLTLYGCIEKKKQITPDAGFETYIQAFTTGTISKESFISIELVMPPEGILSEGGIVPEGLFSFSPAVEGKAYLVKGNTVEFRPEKPLKNGTLYSVEFFLGKLITVDPKYRKMSFQFRTVDQSFSVNFEGMKSYPGQQFDKMNMKGYILTADVCDPEGVEKLLEAEFNGKTLEIQWNHQDDRRQHFFTVDSIQRQKDKPSRILLSWNGSPMDIDIKGEQEFEVPALDVFKILEVKVLNQPDQHISILFSDPLLGNQDLDGLVSIEGDNNLRLVVSGNEIKAWPEKRETGNKQVIVHKGIRNLLYFGLKETETFLVTFQNIRPAVKLIGEGVIVPQGGSLVIPFESVSLNAVDLRVIQIFRNNVLQFFQENQLSGTDYLSRVGRLVYSGKVPFETANPSELSNWKTFKVDIGKFINLEKGAIYRIELRFRKEYSLFNCSESTQVLSDKNITDNGEESETADEGQETENYNYSYEPAPPDEGNSYETQWDSPGWYSDYYLPAGYRWDERDNPCHVSYYNSERFVSRNIFSSDLGIIAKEGNTHEIVIAVSNLLTTQPESGVEVQLYNFQNQLIEKLSTDTDGFARVNLKKKPFLLVAKKGDQFGYLRLDEGTALSLSTFDVSGEEVQEGIKGFIYGERGVWRPGDRIYLTFIMEADRNRIPENHPVLFSFINPRGQVIEKRIETKGENGFYAFPVSTRTTDPTGNWRAEVRIGNSIFTKIIKVETVKPNRLKINLKIPELISPSNPPYAGLEASWLHGAKAGSLKTKVDVMFVRGQFDLKEFDGFSFMNPGISFNPVEQTIFDSKLDENGSTMVPLNFSGLNNAPGLLKAWFTSRVFEEGGDFSINVSQANYAPFARFVGVRMPKSEDNWYKTDTDYSPEIVLINPEGKPVSGGKIEIRLYRIGWRWWWESGYEDLAHYVSSSYYQPVRTWNIENAQHRTGIKLNVPYRTWEDNGRYLLLAADKTGGHSAGTVFYMSRWGGWRSEGSKEGATFLSVNTDKKKYKAGDKIAVTLPSSKSGRALVSIENGSDITDIFWVKTEDQLTRFSVEARPEMAPNVYIHVSLIQPYGQTENDAPLRLYGVVPVFVENPETILQPAIAVSDELKPEKPYSVSISEKNKKQMTYTVAIVDEGLLDLTNFRTPEPHKAFYAREALGIKTWDLYDYVAGAYGAKLQKALAVGGDEDLANKGKKQANRFVPVVQFAGPFTLSKGSVAEHKFNMPNYVGSVRVMVVAGNKGAYGNTEKAVKVRNALMLLATLPRVLGPDEEVSLPVSVFAMKEQVKNVAISVKTNDLLVLEGSDHQDLQFSEPGEKLVRFKLKVKNLTGIGKVDVIASGGGEKATYSIELDIRNPNLPVTIDKSVMVKNGEKVDLSLQAPGMAGTNSGWVEICRFPQLNLSKNLDYLIQYPHGCLEQTVSAGFPQIFLGKLIELTAEQRLKTEDNVKATLLKLPLFQLAGGSFSYWPGINETNEWVTSYAGDFMLKAEQAGYSLPAGIKERWLSYQRNQSRNWNSSNKFRNDSYYQGYDLVQAYRLYTLALANSPDMGAMNRLRESGNKNITVGWRLGAAYLLAGQPDACKQITSALSTQVQGYCEMSGTYGSDLRDAAMILESLVLMGEQEKAFRLLKEISDKMNSGYWLSTQTAAWCLSSAAAFAGKFAKGDELIFNLTVNGKQSNLRSTIPIVKIPANFDQGVKLLANFENKSQGVNFINIVARGIPSGPDTTSASSNLRIELTYFDSSGKEVKASQLKQGEDLKMVVKVKHPGEGLKYEELVLSTVFPSGWEIMNRRLNDLPEKKAEVFDYQDIRDDRIYTYFDLGMNESKTFTFYLNAAYSGRFYQPPVSCEAMYDHTIYARSPGRWVEISAN